MSNTATLKTEVETTTTGLLDRATALETSKATDETNITQLQGGGVRDIGVSFETGEQTTHKVYFPVKVTITKIRGFVTTALAGTDAGTVTAQNAAAAAMTGGVVSIAASSAVGFEPTAASPSTNNVVNAGSFILLVVAKTTAGGKARLAVEYTTTP